MTLLRDPEWSGWSDREIARRCSVDGKTVATLRQRLVGTAEIRTERTYTTKHGTVATMDVSNIGRPAPNDTGTARSRAGLEADRH